MKARKNSSRTAKTTVDFMPNHLRSAGHFWEAPLEGSEGNKIPLATETRISVVLAAVYELAGVVERTYFWGGASISGFDVRNV